VNVNSYDFVACPSQIAERSKHGSRNHHDKTIEFCPGIFFPGQNSTTSLRVTPSLFCFLLYVFSLTLCLQSVATVAADAPHPKIAPDGESLPAVTVPPDSVFEKIREADRDAARAFYKKYVDVGGLIAMSSADVADEALQRTYYIVTHMLAGRPDILEQMKKSGTRLIIIGKDQVYTDMPEYRHTRNPEFMNERVRGTGGLNVTSFGEENLLNLPLDRYDDESIGVHEFGHTIDAALRIIDPTWGGPDGRLAKTYKNAVDNGLWKFAYTGSNQTEYWAEICQSYFDTNRTNNWNHAAVATREQLKQYDPVGYELCRAIFNFSPANDWRYTPVQKQPSVIAPPGRFNIDPYYTKFTWAREFIVVGSNKVSDEALLKANDTIRKLFAYRHDILKALINDGAKLVVLGRGEALTDLPEFSEAKNQAGFDCVRYFDYTPEKKLLVVPEENVLGLASDPLRGQSAVIAAFAKALYQVAGTRPVDPDFDDRRDKQQYEQQLLWNKPSLPINRIDIEFDLKLRKLFDDAVAKSLWKGTPAARDRVEYWAAGLSAYFDAAGSGYAPNDAPRPINSRELLKTYDPDLYDLVDSTMLYANHQDWRYKPGAN
jgi:hypothetical protein